MNPEIIKLRSNACCNKLQTLLTCAKCDEFKHENASLSYYCAYLFVHQRTNGERIYKQ